MIVSPREFDITWFNRLRKASRRRGNQGTKTKHYYKDIVTAFDIETTRITSVEQSVMYIWQWQFGDKCTVVGRTWDEFLYFVNRLKHFMHGLYLVVYVHNLSYEFQFLRGIYDFSEDEVFAVNNRKVLKCEMMNFLEFRCSYLHSNMSLAEFTSKMGAEHGKLSGKEFDYSKQRFSWTPLSDQELAYCVHDVQGLVEALSIEMEHDGDTLYTLPLTSTGYVRRDAKKAMQRVSHYFVEKQLPSFHIYEMLREAFRGGNTHASRYYAGHTLHNVSSADRSSSYPDVLMNREFPVDEFYEVGPCDTDRLMNLIYKRKKAVLMRVRFWNIRLTDDMWGCPYLSRDKCRCTIKGAYDNGRILSAEYLETTITDIDFQIILDEYSFDGMEAYDVAFTRYAKLPEPFLKIIREYYRRKTTLKGTDDELSYFRAKQKLNSLYGMCAQDPVKQNIKFIDDFIVAKDDPEAILAKHNRRAFLCYQWGVWVTAWSRFELEEGLKLAGDDFVYCDTDSVKYLNTLDWSEYNAEKIAASEKSGAFADDANGKRHHMGVFEFEGTYKLFATLGAKKYAYEDEDGKLHITVAGVGKKAGADELAKHGGIKEFKPSFIFTEAGGTEALYNDHPEIDVIKIDGHIQKITSNVVLRESTYTLGITDEYERLLHDCDIFDY